MVGSVGGLLPDLDSDAGKPLVFLFHLISVLIPSLLSVKAVQIGGDSPEFLICYFTASYLFINYIVCAIIKQVNDQPHRAIQAVLHIAAVLTGHSPDQFPVGRHPFRTWAIWREMATRFPFSSHISPSASSNPQVTKRVLREQLSHRDFGMLRMLTVNSMVGTQATIPREARIPGGRESARRRIEAMSYGWSSRSRIQPRFSDRSDRRFCSHPAHEGSRRSSTWRKRL